MASPTATPIPPPTRRPRLVDALLGLGLVLTCHGCGPDASPPVGRVDTTPARAEPSTPPPTPVASTPTPVPIPAADARPPTRAEAVAAAFGPGVRPDAKGRFTWTVATDQALPKSAESGDGSDLRGRDVQASVLRLDPLPPTDDAGHGTASGSTPAASRWLLVTAGPTLRDGQPDDCHGCGTVVSAFILSRSPAPAGTLGRETAAPVLTVEGSFGAPPEVALVPTGPARRALRLESGYTGQGYTGAWQSYYAIAPGFPSLLDKPLAVHGDNEGTCSDKPAERAEQPWLKACQRADTRVRFVPARPGANETDDPGQWVLETTTTNPDGLSDEGVLPAGVQRLAFRRGRYRSPGPPP